MPPRAFLVELAMNKFTVIGNLSNRHNGGNKNITKQKQNKTTKMSE